MRKTIKEIYNEIKKKEEKREKERKINLKSLRITEKRLSDIGINIILILALNGALITTVFITKSEELAINVFAILSKPVELAIAEIFYIQLARIIIRATANWIEKT